MLLNLHVKNLALIEESEVTFGSGLNILSGETGAGKSIIIGSVNLALGGKVSRSMLRENAEFALVELIFSIGYFPGKRGDYYEQKDLCQWKKCQPDQFGDSFCIRDA